MNFLAGILTNAIIKLVTALSEFLVKGIGDYLKGKKDDRKIDEAFKNSDAAHGAGDLDDLFRGGV